MWLLHTRLTARLVHALHSRLVRACSSFGFSGNSDFGYSLMDVDCFNVYAHTHEMAHNFGCTHNKEDTDRVTDYSYGYRRCSGPTQ